MTIKALPIDDVQVETQSDVGYSPMLVEDRGHFSNTNSTYLNNILMLLETKAKRFESTKANGDPEVPEDPVYLLKIRDLEGRSSQTFSNTIKSLVTVDQKVKNRQAKPIAVLCPLILFEGGSLKIEFVLIYPPSKNGMRDARPLYQKCIEISSKSITEALKDRRKKTVSLSNVPEEFDPYYLSYDRELKRRIDKEFDKQQLQRINTDDFERNLISLLARNELVTAASEDYFIVTEEPGDDAEVTAHINYLREGMEKIKDPLLKSKVLSIVENLKAIQLNASSKIKLNELEELKEILTQKIKNNTIGVKTVSPEEDKKRDVTIIDFAAALENIGIDPQEYSEKLQYELLTSLGGVLTEVLTQDQNKRTVGLFVHPEYFIYAEIYLYERAIHHSEYREKVEWVDQIKANILKDKNLKLLLNQGIDSEEMSKLVPELANFKNEYKKQKDKEEFDKKYDLAQLGMASIGFWGLTSVLYFFIFSSYPGTIAMLGSVVYGLLFKKFITRLPHKTKS